MNDLGASDFSEDEAPFRAIAESANDVIVVIDADSRIRFVNQRVERTFGYPPEELVGEPLTRIMPPRFHEGHHQGISRYLETGDRTLDWSDIELPGRREDGTEVPLHISFSEFTRDGAHYFVGVLRDISERKDREETLKFQRSLLEAQQEAMLDGTLLVGPDREIVSYNDRFVDLWGIPEDIVEHGDEQAALEWALDRMADPEAFLETVEHLYENPDQTHHDEVELADGRVFERYSTPVRADDGSDYGRLWMYRDITDRKARERQVEGYKHLFENTSDCIVETEFVDGEPVIRGVNAAFEETFGYDESAVAGSNLDSLIVPEDLDYEAADITSSAEAGESFSREVVRETADGRCEFRWRPVHADDDRLYAIYTDITDRKERERELERAERRFDAVFNAPSALVTLLDPEGHIEEISDAAVALVEESRAEIRGRPLWEGPWFEGDADLQRNWRETVERALDGQSARTGASSVRVPDQELVVDAIFEPVTDADGTLTGVVGVARDITERYRDQRIRRQLLSKTREMVAADSREGLARTVSETADSILEFDLNGVYLQQDPADPLEPVAWSDDVDDLLDGPPSLSGEDPVSEAFAAGEPAVYDDLAAAVDGGEAFAPVASLLTLPIDDHGVLAVGATEPGAFTEADLERYRLLTVSAATAFDGLERTLEMQRYETLFETVEDQVYVLDEDGHLELVSESLAAAVGYDRETLEGQHISAVVTEATAQDIEHLIFDLVVTPAAVSSTAEGTLVARDGTETPVEIELSVLPHEESFRGTAGVIRDISERRQREEELQVLRRAITKAGIGLAMYDANGRFEYVNDHYADMLGQTREGLESSRLWNTVEPLTPESFETHWTALGTNETSVAQSEHRRADGSTVPVETVTTAVEVGGTRRHIMTVQDITDRRERRQQAEALHRILRHNLRNDLTVVRGHVEILADRFQEPDDETVDTIVDTTEELVDLTETAAEARDLLDRETDRQPVNVTEVIEARVAELRQDFQAAVDLELPDRQHVMADPMLGTAIDHLLENAVEHNDASPPRVWVRVSTMEDRPEWVQIEVADNGPGIPDVEKETIIAGEEQALQHSIGLGLWIVQWVVSRYGGDLAFEERAPRGTRVQLALPTPQAGEPTRPVSPE